MCTLNKNCCLSQNCSTDHTLINDFKDFLSTYETPLRLCVTLFILGNIILLLRDCLE